MNITTTAPAATMIRPASTAATPTVSEQASQTPVQDTFKSSVTRAAYAGCGALGGLALGAVSGEVMTHLTKNEVFSSLGGGVGAIGGAATSLALALSDQPVSMGRVFGSWAGASAGATGGMYMMREVGAHLASHGADAYFGSHGALIGAVGLGLAGTGIAFSGDESKVGTIIRSSAKAGAGAMVGLAAGGAIQALASSQPQLALLTASTPFVLAGALSLMGVQNDINKGWINGYRYQPKSAGLDMATKSVLGGTLGYAAGSVVGGIALSVGGSAAYSVVAPALGIAVGAAGVFGQVAEKKTFSDMALAAGAAGGVGVLGDAIGHGLTALTGQPAFQMLGAATGAVTGVALELDRQKRIPSALAPVALGFTAGTTAGTLLGAGLTALTGHSAYQLAGTAIGSVAGVLSGLAGWAHQRA